MEKEKQSDPVGKQAKHEIESSMDLNTVIRQLDEISLSKVKKKVGEQNQLQKESEVVVPGVLHAHGDSGATLAELEQEEQMILAASARRLEEEEELGTEDTWQGPVTRDDYLTSKRTSSDHGGYHTFCQPNIL